MKVNNKNINKTNFFCTVWKSFLQSRRTGLKEMQSPWAQHAAKTCSLIKMCKPALHTQQVHEHTSNVHMHFYVLNCLTTLTLIFTFSLLAKKITVNSVYDSPLLVILLLLLFFQMHWKTCISFSFNKCCTYLLIWCQTEWTQFYLLTLYPDWQQWFLKSSRSRQ